MTQDAAPRKGRPRRGRAAAIQTVAVEAVTWTLDRPPTINDVARLAHVSKKTVSRVINQSPFVNEETRTIINAIIEQIGYMPSPQARGLAFQRSFLLGLVYDNPNAQFIVNIQEGVLAACRLAGFELVVHPCDQKSPHFLNDAKQFVQRQNLDGVIVVPPASENPQLVEVLRDLGCRYVRLSAVSLDEAANMVVYNDRQGAAEVAEHLAGLGHRDIGFIAGPSRHRSAHERRESFVGALRNHGITLRPEMVEEGAYTFESGEVCATRLLTREPRPTAIFASNDEMAAGVYKTAQRLGISIPRDLTIVGFDDSPIATRLWPSLTTVRLPAKDLGRLAAEKLIIRISSDEEEGHTATGVVSRMVVRESSVPPRG
ncbi:LacI family DNA-binding transcriptional regulator [Nitrospirillum sp. BR 11163]|uniref:LacI family DNA-binding transcriptional regulator n=1 Tax=Nitrospirillum sp. BR 11163 TaxID=3104323 RepID=UPI002AFE171F|nr:LacI family DNA-binding transcriptional regulator [Nitrospirillum sp. BR 11163]MEA1676414.1 LacI family DNA-binding transcriptional regulator [Nitrospirillum sp. BR 11163]